MANNLKKLKNRVPSYYRFSGKRLQEYNGTEWVNVDSIDITANQFIKAYNNNELISHMRYSIQDYQLLHYIPHTSEIRQSSKEKIMVETVENGKIKPLGRSLDFPQDIIYFDPKGDKADPDQVPINDSRFKGFIYRRIDEENNNDIAFDYRNVKFRRWKVDSTDAAKVGINPDQYYLPRPDGMPVGWTWGVHHTGYNNKSDNWEYDNSIILNPVDENNQYKDFYPFGDTRTPENNGLFDNNYMRSCNVHGNGDNGIGPGFGTYGKVGKWNLPNFVVLPTEDSLSSFELKYWGVDITTDRYGDVTFSASDINTFEAGGFSFMNSIIASDNGNRAALSGKLGKFQNNVYTGFASTLLFNEGDLQNSLILGFNVVGFTFEGVNFGFLYYAEDSDGNIVNNRSYGSSAGGNLIKNAGLIGFKNTDGSFPQIHGTRIVTSPLLHWGGSNGVNLFIENVNFDKDIIDFGFLNKSTARKSYDIDTNDNSITLNKIDTYNGKGGDFRFYGELLITSGSTLELINNPPEVPFKVIPDSGVSVTLTHNTNSNGIRLLSADQPDITLNGDNGDFAELEINDGNIQVLRYYQF